MLRLFALALAVGCGGTAAPEAPVQGAAPPRAAPSGEIDFAPATDLVAIRAEPEGTPEAAPTPAAAAPAAKSNNTGSSTSPLEEGDPGLGTEGGRTLSAQQISGTIKTNLPKVRACYEQGLKSNPGLAGKLVLAWTVGADGRVRDVETVSNGVRDNGVVSCIRKSVAKWRFAKAQSPSDVEYPFVLKSNNW